MSDKNPIIAVTGSSGAGTSTTTNSFSHIFRSLGIDAALVEGDCFHRFSRPEMDVAIRKAKEQGKYISFIRGRAGRKVADFFLDFLGCEEGTDAKANSKAVLASVEEYFTAAEFDSAEKNDARKQVYSYCEERAKAGQDVVLTELSAVIDEQEQQGFLRYCQEQQLQVAEQFPVEVKELKKLIKFSGQGAGLSISFEQKLLGDRVQYDPHSDTILIKGTPPNLRDQLQRFIQGYSAFDRAAGESE